MIKAGLFIRYTGHLLQLWNGCCQIKRFKSFSFFSPLPRYLLLTCWLLSSCQLFTVQNPLKDEIIIIPESTKPVQSVENAPPARVFHQMIYDSRRHVVVLFGGDVLLAKPDAEDEVYFDDTWEFDGKTWKEIKTTIAPPERRGHGMMYDAYRDVVVMYGGETPEHGLADTWEYDGAQWRLTIIDADPGQRIFPFMLFDPRKQVVFLMAGLQLSDVWEYDGISWTRLLEYIPTPIRMPFFTQVVFDIRREIFVFTTGLGETLELGDFYRSDLGIDMSDLQEAAFRMETGGTRSEYSFIYDTKRGVAVLFGGRRSFRSEGDLEAKYVTLLNDTWEYDGEKWYEVKTPQSPLPRYLHAMAYDEARGVIVLFGGADADNNALNDTWEYDGITWVQR
ncbi:MAG: hypothetical protein IAE79_02080 [Anaerolinea sp.]|nr:hypothetical protein [Anaerolinea sp.]